MRRLILACVLAPGLCLGAGADPPRNKGLPAGASPVARARLAIQDGVSFLVRTQNPDGSFGYHAQKRSYRIFAPVPGAHRAFRYAVTALAALALGRAPDPGPAARRARSRALRFLLESKVPRRSQGNELYCVWGLAYGLQALALALGEAPPPGGAGALRARAAVLVDLLRRYQTLDGGWTYLEFRAKTARPSARSASFVTGTVLQALHAARRAGLEVPEIMVRRAIRSLRRCRTKEGTYLYSLGWRYHPQGLINRPGGSLSRTPGNDLALHLFGAGIDREDLARAVETLVRERRFARAALHRPVPHESWFSVSGYFHLFGYYNAAECCRRLPPARVRELRDPLIEEILYTRAPDGSFWDYPLYGYHKPYGTSFAVLALAVLAAPEQR